MKIREFCVLFIYLLMVISIWVIFFLYGSGEAAEMSNKYMSKKSLVRFL